MKKWLGRLDSNQRIPGPKPGALPLGDAPKTRISWTGTIPEKHTILDNDTGNRRKAGGPR